MGFVKAFIIIASVIAVAAIGVVVYDVIYSMKNKQK